MLSGERLAEEHRPEPREDLEQRQPQPRRADFVGGGDDEGEAEQVVGARRHEPADRADEDGPPERAVAPCQVEHGHKGQ